MDRQTNRMIPTYPKKTLFAGIYQVTVTLFPHSILHTQSIRHPVAPSKKSHWLITIFRNILQTRWLVLNKSYSYILYIITIHISNKTHRYHDKYKPKLNYEANISMPQNNIYPNNITLTSVQLYHIQEYFFITFFIFIYICT